MPVIGLNHAVLYVRDLDVSAGFYIDHLGFRPLEGGSLAGALFLTAPGSTNDHDLGLFQVGADAEAASTGRHRAGLYHLAWEVDTLAELARLTEVLGVAGALVGSSDHGTTKSLYGRDPDGNEFELAWLVPAAAVTDEALEARLSIGPLDLDAEMTRYGADTPGGIGVSRR